MSSRSKDLADDSDKATAVQTMSISSAAKGETRRISTNPSAEASTSGSGKGECYFLDRLTPQMVIEVVRHLNFGDIMRLRFTCSALYNICTPEVVLSTYGSTNDYRLQYVIEKLHTCHICFITYSMYDKSHFLDLGRQVRREFLPAVCVPCARANNMIDVRRWYQHVPAAYLPAYYTRLCRWCGCPSMEPGYKASFHPGTCDKRYRLAWHLYWCKWLLSNCLIIVGAALWPALNHAVDGKPSATATLCLTIVSVSPSPPRRPSSSSLSRLDYQFNS
jgi:hypothetical protein